MHPPSIAIIGAGFSGTLLALHLSRLCAPAVRIHLIEQAPEFGTGAAYSTHRPDHLLNVPAGRMSAFQDQPMHFLNWLQCQPANVLNGLTPEAGSFVPRRLYGKYMRGLLADAAPRRRLELMRGEVVAIAREPTGLTLRLDAGGTVTASIVVLATGNNPPADPCPALRATPLYRPNPWAADIADGVPADGAVLLIGTGLTMVDTVLHLQALGHRGPIHALSRRGLLPNTHAALPAPAPSFDPGVFPREFRALARFIRVESERIAATGCPWHAVVDALRPITQDIWRCWSPLERRRFLVHARPFWDAHRHRMAPEIAHRIEAARASGQLRIHAGRITGFTTLGDAADVAWRPRGKPASESLRVHRIDNCTGPAASASDPLTRSLLATGLARPDPHGLGFDVTSGGALRGSASDRLFGVGPVCRSALWEITAVPDIRVQCEKLARVIAEQLPQAEWPDVHVPPPHAAMTKISGLWF